MRRSVPMPLLLSCTLFAAFLTGCTLDKNVRKQKYYESGEKYFSEGKFAEAAIQYSNAVLVDSNFAQAHSQLGEVYLKLGDRNRAYQELSKAVGNGREDYRAYIDLANLLIAVRNPDGSPDKTSFSLAKTYLDRLRENQPKNPETHEAWSNYYAAQNELGPAMDEIQQAIDLDQYRSEAYLLRGLLQLRSNLTDDAETSFNKAVDVSPGDLSAQMALAGFYRDRNRLSEAEAIFRKAIKDSKNPGPFSGLAQLLMQEGRKKETEELLKQAKKDLPNNSEGYRMLGDFYFANGDLDKAESEYESLYRDHPKDPKVKRNYIQLLILKNRVDEASTLNEEILKSAPEDVDALIYEGQIQMRRNDPAGAIESLGKAIRNDPDNAVAHYQLGLAYEQEPNESSAVSEWREAVRIRPDLADAQRALASTELKNADIDGLLQTAQQIIAAHPNSADGFLLKGIADTVRQKFSDASQDAQRAMQLAPQSPAPLVEMGNVHLAQKQYAAALEFYQQALDRDPSSAEALSGVMNTCFAQKQYDKAIAAANAQIGKFPNSSNFYDLLGTALFNGKKDSSAAEAALSRAVELDKNNVDAIEKLGKIQIGRGATDQALSLYGDAIRQNPKQVVFYVLTGEIYAARQDWDEAKAMYQEALSIQPEQPMASNNLAYIMLEQGGNVDVAFAMAQTARRGLPDSSNAADTLGWAYFHKGLYQSAISQFGEALRLNQNHGVADDATIHYHLGLAYQKSNQLALARQQLERALKLSPNNADAKKALSGLRS